MWFRNRQRQAYRGQSAQGKAIRKSAAILIEALGPPERHPEPASQLPASEIG